MKKETISTAPSIYPVVMCEIRNLTLIIKNINERRKQNILNVLNVCNLETGTVYTSREPAFTLVVCGVCVVHS